MSKNFDLKKPEEHISRVKKSTNLRVVIITLSSPKNTRIYFESRTRKSVLIG